MAKEKEYIYDLRKFTQYDHAMGDAKKNLTKVGLCVSLPKKYINLRSGVFFSSFSPLAEKKKNACYMSWTVFTIEVLLQILHA